VVVVVVVVHRPIRFPDYRAGTTRISKPSAMKLAGTTAAALHIDPNDGGPMADSDFPGWHGTTIIGVKKGGEVVVAGDGQVSLGQTVIKGTARKVRACPPAAMTWWRVLRGPRRMPSRCWNGWKPSWRRRPASCSAPAWSWPKDWRTDKYLQKLEAMLIVTDGAELLVITGAGDVLEPEHGIAAIGSGGNYALAAARGMLDSGKDAETIARDAMAIAADICVYTNGNLTVERITP
jgi:ATP-dependent HslUV protease subunit HslV